MTAYNIFYDSNKEIVWASTAPVNSGITTAEAAKGKKNFIVDEEGNPLPVPQLRPLNRRYGGKVKKMRGGGIMSLSNNRGY